jgi:hypothetical protein
MNIERLFNQNLQHALHFVSRQGSAVSPDGLKVREALLRLTPLQKEYLGAKANIAALSEQISRKRGELAAFEKDAEEDMKASERVIARAVAEAGRIEDLAAAAKFVAELAAIQAHVA